MQDFFGLKGVFLFARNTRTPSGQRLANRIGCQAFAGANAMLYPPLSNFHCHPNRAKKGFLQAEKARSPRGNLTRTGLFRTLGPNFSKELSKRPGEFLLLEAKLPFCFQIVQLIADIIAFTSNDISPNALPF